MITKRLVALILIWQIAKASAYRSSRLRRQVIPSEHIQVHSLESSVLLQDLVVVDSSENRIDLDEAKVKGSIWSDKSLMSFDSQDTFVNVSAVNVDSFFNIQNCAMLHAQAGDSDFYMRSNRTEDGNSAISHNLNNRANFSIQDEGLNIQAVGGRRVELEAQSWEKNIDKEMSLSSFTSPDFEKIVQLKAIASLYNIEARFFGSTIFISFADKVIRIDPLTKNIIIFTDKFTVEIRVNETDYGVTMNPREVVVALPVEETTICVDLAGVSVQARKLAKTTIERNGGEMNVGGLFTNAESVQMNALSTELSLSNEGKTTADAMNSEMVMSNPLQKIHLASAHHNLKINGGVPHIFIEPGYICVDIKANHGMPHFMNIMPPFVAPEDKFVNAGPFGAGKTKTTLTTILFPRDDKKTTEMATSSTTSSIISTSSSTTTFTTTQSSIEITTISTTTENISPSSSTISNDQFVVTQYAENYNGADGKIKDDSKFENYVRLYSKITMTQTKGDENESDDGTDFPKPVSLIHYRPQTSEARQIRNPFYKQENVDNYGFLKQNGPFDGHKTGTEEETQETSSVDYVDSSNNIVYSPHIYTTRVFGTKEDKKSKRLFMVRLTIPENVKITTDDIVKRLDFNFQHISESLSDKFLNRERRDSTKNAKNPYEISMIEMRKRADTLSVVFGIDKNIVENEVLKEIAVSHRFSFQPFEVLLFAENVAPVNTSMRGFVLCSICAILCIFYYAWKSHRRASNSRSNIPRVPLEGDEEDEVYDGEEGIENDDEEADDEDEQPQH